MSISNGDFQVRRLFLLPPVVTYNCPQNYRNLGLYQYFQRRFSIQKAFYASCSQIQLSAKLQKSRNI